MVPKRSRISGGVPGFQALVIERLVASSRFIPHMARTKYYHLSALSVLHVQVNSIQNPQLGISVLGYISVMYIRRMRAFPFPCSSSHIVSRNIQGTAVVGQDGRNIISPRRTRTRRIAHELKMKRRRGLQPSYYPINLPHSRCRRQKDGLLCPVRRCENR